ncbi:MAG: VanW family protein [Patescibacteria group bacterium]
MIKELSARIDDYEKPKRLALSKKYPELRKPIIASRQIIKNFDNFFNFKIKYKKQEVFFDFVIKRHQSVLRRRLGDSDQRLQEQKIINLKLAIEKLNGIIIKPGDIFSLWKIVGKPKYKDGYVDGMLLSNGQVIEGLGGGLCQLSNFLHWIFLHAPLKIVERYHHSMDVFPDSSRTLPFGSGATILYNFIDLKAKNISKSSLQLKLWLTDNHLKGQIISAKPWPQKYHLFEKNNLFVKKGEKYYRYNEIYRETKLNGKVQKVEKILTNFAPVLYPVTNEYLNKHGFKLLKI